MAAASNVLGQKARFPTPPVESIGWLSPGLLLESLAESLPESRADLRAALRASTFVSTHDLSQALRMSRTCGLNSSNKCIRNIELLPFVPSSKDTRRFQVWSVSCCVLILISPSYMIADRACVTSFAHDEYLSMPLRSVVRV